MIDEYRGEIIDLKRCHLIYSRHDHYQYNIASFRNDVMIFAESSIISLINSSINYLSWRIFITRDKNHLFKNLQFSFNELVENSNESHRFQGRQKQQGYDPRFFNTHARTQYADTLLQSSQHAVSGNANRA